MQSITQIILNAQKHSLELELFNWTRLHLCFPPMASLYRDQFINLPFTFLPKLNNWFQYDEIVDRCKGVIFSLLSHLYCGFWVINFDRQNYSLH